MNGSNPVDIFFMLAEAPGFIARGGQSWGGDIPGYDLVVLFAVLGLQGVLLVLCIWAWRKRIPGMRVFAPLLVLSTFGFVGATVFHWLISVATAYHASVYWTYAVDMIIESIQVVAIILLISAVVRINRLYHGRGTSTFHSSS